jgi:RNA polymerase sigma-70 factor (ECF subfamily)
VDFSNLDVRDEQSSRVVLYMELYSRHHRQLYVYIASLVANPVDAQDLLQDTALTLWQKFDEFQPNTSFLAWARTIARYRVLQYREKVQRAVGILPPQLLEVLSIEAEATPSEEMEVAHHEALLECLQKLRPADQELVRLRYQSKASVKDLAESQGRSPNAVSRALARIRGALFDCMRFRLNRSAAGDANA